METKKGVQKTNFEKQKVKTIVKIGSVMLIALLLGMAIGYAVSPSATFTFTGGIFPGAPNYTVWREGSYYFAKDANGDLPSWSGSTNITKVVMNTVSSNSITYVCAGLYYMTSPIIIEGVYNFTLTGCGTATRLIMTTNNSMINVLGTSGSNLRYITITSIHLEGYSGNPYTTDKSNIYFYYVRRSYINHVTMYAGAGNGIKIEESPENIQVSDITVTDVSGNGIWLLSVGDAMLSNVKVWGSIGNGLVIQSSGAIDVSGSHFDSSVLHAVQLYDATHITISGCQIYDFDYNSVQTYDGINIACSGPGATSDVTISSTQIFNSYSHGRYCIAVCLDVNRTSISNVNCIGALSGTHQLAGIIDSGTYTHVTASWNVTDTAAVWIETYP